MFDPTKARESNGLLLHPCDRCEGGGVVPNELPEHYSPTIPATVTCPTCGGKGEREADKLATAVIKLDWALSRVASMDEWPRLQGDTLALICEAQDLIADAREQVRLRGHSDDLWEARRKPPVEAPCEICASPIGSVER